MEAGELRILWAIYLGYIPNSQPLFILLGLLLLIFLDVYLLYHML